MRTRFLAMAVRTLVLLAGLSHCRPGYVFAAPMPVISWEYDQLRPAIAYAGASNEFLVVWEDHHRRQPRQPS